MWEIIFAVTALVLIAGAGYLIWRFHRFSFLNRLGKRHRLLSWLAAALMTVLLGLFAMISASTMVVIVIHLIIAFLLCDLVAWALEKLIHRKISRDISGVIAVGLCAVYLGIGCFMAWHIFETHYTVETQKEIGGDLRIVGIADSHLGITLDGERFAEQMERIRKLKPDIVVVAGDFVDGDSEKEDMLLSCKALGSLLTDCDVYFVYGNHDDDSSYRNFTPEDLHNALTENGICVLEDDTVRIREGVYLTGRKDDSDRRRAGIEELKEELDSSGFWIVIDHQPTDYDAEAAAGADLVFSGHTHGGHVFPSGQIGMLIGANDKLYGAEKRQDTVFVVTSGISGWSIPIKTGTYSEIVVIDIVKAQ